MKCSEYITENDDDLYPCHCPICGGFLKWEWNHKENEYDPICNKCGTELMTFPEIDEETGEELNYGKICPISNPQEFKQNS